VFPGHAFVSLSPRKSIACFSMPSSLLTVFVDDSLLGRSRLANVLNRSRIGCNDRPGGGPREAYMSLMRNSRHSPDLRPSDFQADPIKRLPTVQPNVIEQRELLTNLHFGESENGLTTCRDPHLRSVPSSPAYPPSAAYITTKLFSAPVQVLAAGRWKPALYPPS
jgi:hypothetical protein